MGNGYMNLDTPLVQLGISAGFMRRALSKNDPRSEILAHLKRTIPNEPAALWVYFTSRAFEEFKNTGLLPKRSPLRDSIREIRARRHHGDAGN